MKIWTTRDGTKIPYDKLKFNHIYNIIKYAQNKGFYIVYASHSSVDNTDDITMSRDCSNEVIRDMKAELRNRNIANAYYVERFLAHDLKRVSPVFESKEEACMWAFYQHWPRKDCRIIKEYLY